MDPPSLDIVIVNWNTGGFLRECLDSIVAAQDRSFELKRVVVVDNASEDGSADGLEGIALPLVLIRNAKNRGFAAACNQGARGTKARYLLFLNPDTRLGRDSLREPVRFMEEPEHERIGICGVNLADENGEPSTVCARFPTLGLHVCEMFGLPALFPKTFPRRLLRSEDLVAGGEVDQVIGAFFMVRSDLFSLLNGFDERFFVYYEEVDLCLRAKKEGYVAYYLSDAKASHVGCVSSRQVSAASLFYSLSSRFKYAYKHYRRWEALTLVLLTFSAEFVTRVLRAATGASAATAGEVLTAYRKLLSSTVRGGMRCN